MSTHAQRFEQSEASMGSNRLLRNSVLFFISLLVILTEINLILFVCSVHPPFASAALFYSFPVIHLLPWLAGLQSLGTLKKSVMRDAVGSPAIRLGYTSVLIVLVAAYVALGAGEQLGMSAYRLSMLHSLLPQ
jgi:hypothetical protein